MFKSRLIINALRVNFPKRGLIVPTLRARLYTQVSERQPRSYAPRGNENKVNSIVDWHDVAESALRVEWLYYNPACLTYSSH